MSIQKVHSQYSDNKINIIQNTVSYRHFFPGDQIMVSTVSVEQR